MNRIDMEKAKSMIVNYEYAYLQLISEHILERVDNITSIDWDELMEGYFFSEKGQIHIYREDDELVAVEINDDIADANILNRKYYIAGKYESMGKYVLIREYLLMDEDGQTYVAATRLVDIE